MSDLENGMVTIIRVFHKYSGHDCKLKKADLKELINNEMSNFILVSNRTKSENIFIFMVALSSLMFVIICKNQLNDNFLSTSFCHFHVYFEKTMCQS